MKTKTYLDLHDLSNIGHHAIISQIATETGLSVDYLLDKADTLDCFVTILTKISDLISAISKDHPHIIKEL